jgi:hypothetical protein
MVFLMSFVANLRHQGFTVWLDSEGFVNLNPRQLLVPGQLDYLKANKKHTVKELELEIKTSIRLE